MTELVEERGHSVALSCRLFGRCRQAWYQSKADITYIAIGNGDVCYLHLITDAYSHKIIGWVLADTLRAAITKEALEQAVSQAGDILPDTLITTQTVEYNTVATSTWKRYANTISVSV